MYVYIYPPAPLGATRLRGILGLSNKSYSLSWQSQQQVLQPFLSCTACRSYVGVFLAFMQPCLEVIFLSSLPAIWTCCFLAPLDEEFTLQLASSQKSWSRYKPARQASKPESMPGYPISQPSPASKPKGSLQDLKNEVQDLPEPPKPMKFHWFLMVFAISAKLLRNRISPLPSTQK